MYSDYVAFLLLHVAGFISKIATKCSNITISWCIQN